MYIDGTVAFIPAKNPTPRAIIAIIEMNLAFVFLISLNLAPAWVVAIIVCRELAVTGLRLILAENKGQVLAAKMPGKIKTTTQMLSIIFLLLGDVYFIGTILLYICLIFTIYSGYDYFKQSGDVFKGEI